MAINFGLAGDGFDALQVLQAYGQAQTQKLTQMRVEREEQTRQRVEASRPRVQERISAKDYTGAQTAAIEGGDYDAAKAIGALSDDHRKQAADQADVMGSVATSLKSVPIEQRGAAFQAALPALRARGFSDQDLQGVDLSDASLDGYAASALSVKDALAAHTKANEQYTLAPGSARYDATGKLIVEQPFAPRPISVSPGETVVEYQPGQRGSGASASPVTGEQVEQLALAAVPGAQVTSRTRTPEHNREVGGKPNSYHLTGQARDLVPPQGMTMAQFDRTIRPTMEAQGLRVINEGDHIHVQPSSRSGGGPRVIAQGAPKIAAEDRAPSGYRWAGGNLEPIPGGPGDFRQSQTGQKEVVELRKQFDALPEVKDFKQVRSAFQQVRSVAAKPKPSPSDDIALVFSYMKMLDPGSVVREGEYATAANAASVPERIRTAYNKALSGNALGAEQRKNMALTAATIYKQQRTTYNEVAGRYQGYARDIGADPNGVAVRANENDRRRSPAAAPRITGGADYRALPSGTIFIDPQGKKRRKP